MAWAAFVVGRVSDLRDGVWSQSLLLFAALVLVPLVLELLAEPDDSPVVQRGFRAVKLGQLPAALLLAVACWLTPGAVAGLATLPWVALTVALAWLGLLRLLRGGFRRDFEGICADVAMVFSVIGGIWTLSDRCGFAPLGFDPAIVALTAVHFHYAGLLLPLFAGLVQRELFFWRSSARAAVGVILGVPAVAAGITATQIGWGTSLEKAAGCGLALAGMAVGVLQVRIAVDGGRDLMTRVLLGISGAALFVGMVFAMLYALRSTVVLVPGLELPQMRMWHGTINAIGFGLCGVLGWRRVGRPE